VRSAQLNYLVAALSLAGGCSLDVAGLPGPRCGDRLGDDCGVDVAGLPGPACGDHVVDPGEACDDSSAFCGQCQFACPAGWVKSSTAATCFKVFPPPLSSETPDWDSTKSWASADTACAAEAPSRQYTARLAGPGVLDVLPQLTDCPQIMTDGRGGCWIGARCPDGVRCANGDVALEWSGLGKLAIPSRAWSSGNPSGDGVCVEFIPSEGINDDNCDKTEHYLCEVTLSRP
jgi:hypothetical protein